MLFPLAPLALALRLAVPDPGFQTIVDRVGIQSHDDDCTQMIAWVDAHRDDPNAGRGLIWMAELRLADHRLDLARPFFERAAHDYAGTEWGWQGEKGVADLQVARHDYAPAIAAFERLSKVRTAYWEYVGRMSARSARQERTRWFAFVALLAALVLGVGFRVVRARRTLWPLPEETLYALPVVLVMLAAAAAQPPAEAHAVVTLALGGVVLLYAHGVHLRSRGPSLWARLAEGGIGLLEAATLLYCAVIANGLWMKFAETLTSGAER